MVKCNIPVHTYIILLITALVLPRFQIITVKSNGKFKSHILKKVVPLKIKPKLGEYERTVITTQRV